MAVDMKESIAQAVKTLVMEKGVRRLTVKEIVEECHITRQAFYYHFEDIPGVIQWILQREAKRTMLEAQSAKYWPRTICRTGPMLPRFFTGDPDQRMIGTLSAAIDPERLKRLKKEMEQACLLLDSLAGKTGVRRMQWLHDLRWTARRLLAAVLRAELCFRHAWYTGAVWIDGAGRHALRQDYETYRNLAAGDIALHRKVWRRDCLPGGLGESCALLKTAAESAGKTIHCPENTLLYFPPENP